MAAKKEENDFGFSLVDEDEFLAYERNQHKAAVDTQAQTKIAEVEEHAKGKMAQLEDLILPLLNNLVKNPEKIYIKWPNREKIVKDQINKILAITRSE